MRENEKPSSKSESVERPTSKQKILERLYLIEEEKGERRATFFILVVIIPSILAITSILVLQAKFHLNGVFNLLMAAALGVYYSIIALLLKFKAYKPFLKYVSVSVNIVILTISLCGYSIQSGWIHTMRTTVLSSYLFAIVAAGLYQNPAVPLFAGGLSSVAYGAIALYGILVLKTPITQVETFYRPVYSYDVLIWVLAVFAFMSLIMSSLNKRYRLMLERSLSSEAYSKVVKRANAQKTRFFINLAHETKTPLTLISNYMEEFAEKHGTEPEIAMVREYVEKLRQDMVNFLDIEKLKKGMVFYDHARIVDASRALAPHCFLFKEHASRKGVLLTSEIAAEAYTRIDAFALDRVFRNLIDNAVKYADRDGSVKVELAVKDGAVEFSVENTGAAIPAWKHKDIFKPFHQLSHEKRNVQGMGMGLAIVKRVVEDAGGRIRLESSPAAGTRFIVSLPAASPSPKDIIVDRVEAIERPIPEMELPLFPQDSPSGKPSLLIVEDNKALLRYLQEKLRGDYDVRYALNGEEALEALRSPPLPDIIVSDVMMDVMDGYELLSRVSESAEYASVPFIFLTALANYRHKIRALRKGAIDYMYKPFHIDELREKIKAILRIRDALSPRGMKEVRLRLGQRTLAEESALSARQVQVAALLGIGLERKEIADRLGISLNTVNTQIRRMFEKCGVNNKVELLNLLSADLSPREG